jgi:hypothetical protein
MSARSLKIWPRILTWSPATAGFLPLIVWLLLRWSSADLGLERAGFAAVDSEAVWLVEVRMRDATNWTFCVAYDPPFRQLIAYFQGYRRVGMSHPQYTTRSDPVCTIET